MAFHGAIRWSELGYNERNHKKTCFSIIKGHSFDFEILLLHSYETIDRKSQSEKAIMKLLDRLESGRVNCLAK